MRKATFVRILNGRPDGDMRLYHVSPPVEYEKYDFVMAEAIVLTTEHVAVSAVPHVGMGGPETYIFPHDGKDTITDWGELEGSFRGEMNHARALRGLLGDDADLSEV